MTVDDLLGVSAYFHRSHVLVPLGATFKNKTKPDPNLSSNALDILVQYSSTGLKDLIRGKRLLLMTHIFYSSL